MVDFERLEKRCKRYRLKKFFPFLFFILLFIAIGFSYDYYFNQKESLAKNGEEKNISSNRKSTKIIQIDNENVKKECYAMQFLDSKKDYISEIKNMEKELEVLGFYCYTKYSLTDLNRVFLRCNVVKNLKDLKKYKTISKENNLDFFIVKEDCRYLKRDDKNKKNIKKEISKKDSSNLEQNLSKKLLSINEPTLKELEDLFRKRESYNLAIKISKIYLEKKDFKNSLKWSKIANKLDNEPEDSWILYAKSLYNLGDKDAAREILEVYLKFKYSKKIENLLQKWRNDT